MRRDGRMDGAVRKRLLFSLMMTLMLLSAATVLLTAYAIENQEASIDAIMRSYVLDLSDGIVRNLATGNGEAGHGGMARGHGRMMHMRMLTMIPTLQREGAGGALVLAPDGRSLAASPGGEMLRALWRDDLPLDEPVEVRDSRGVEYYMVVRKVEQGLTVMAAVSRTYLLNPVTGLWRFRMFLALTTSLALFTGILFLWRYLVAPLRLLVGSIRRLKWGRDHAEALPYKGFFEVEALSGAIEDLSGQAIEREELKARYVSDMVRIQEDSRGSLARELHDGPLQGIVAAIKHIQLAAGSPASFEKLRLAEEVAQSAARDVRNYCDELSPSWVSLGLSAAILENADRLSRSFGVEIVLSGVEDAEAFPGISEERVLALIRIMQEAISNSARHGGARRVEVSLQREGGSLCLAIADDGDGFSPVPEDETDFERLRTMGHRGLANIYERTQLLHGTMKVWSMPGEGSRIEVVLPFYTG